MPLIQQLSLNALRIVGEERVLLDHMTELQKLVRRVFTMRKILRTVMGYSRLGDIFIWRSLKTEPTDSHWLDMVK